MINKTVFKMLKSSNKMKKDNAFVSFYDAYYEHVYYKIKNHIDDRETIRDLVDDVFLKFYKSVDSIKEYKAIHSYLERIITSTVNDYFRKNRSNLNTLPFDDSLDYEYSYENDNSFKYLMKLNELEQRIVKLYVISNCTFREIGSILKISPARVFQIYESAINKIRKVVKEEEEDEYVKS